MDGSTNGTRWKELFFRVLRKSPMQMVLLNIKISRNPNGLFVCLQRHNSKFLHNSICLLNLVQNSNIFQNIWFLLKLVVVPTLCRLSRVVLRHHNTLVGTVCLKQGFSTFFPVSTPESCNQCRISPTLPHPKVLTGAPLMVIYKKRICYAASRGRIGLHAAQSNVSCVPITFSL